MAHHLTFGADLVFFGVLIGIVAAGRKDNKFAGLLPLALAVTSVLLIMIDPMRHILADHGGVICEESKLAMYETVDGAVVLSPVGRWCRKTTVLGFVSLAVAALYRVGAFHRVASWIFNLLGSQPEMSTIQNKTKSKTGESAACSKP